MLINLCELIDFVKKSRELQQEKDSSSLSTSDTHSHGFFNESTINVNEAIKAANYEVNEAANEDETNQGSGVIYTNQFVLKIPGGESAAKEFASKHGFIYLDQVSN